MMSDRYSTAVQEEVNLKFKQESMWPDFFASTFYSMITKYKDRYGLLDEDVAEYYFEALFLLMMLTSFCIAILMQIEWGKIIDISDDYAKQACQLLTAFMLHTASVMSIRNGS